MTENKPNLWRKKHLKLSKYVLKMCKKGQKLNQNIKKEMLKIMKNHDRCWKIGENWIIIWKKSLKVIETMLKINPKFVKICPNCKKKMLKIIKKLIKRIKKCKKIYPKSWKNVEKGMKI